MSSLELDKLDTEARNQSTLQIDAVPTVELCRLINNEDMTIASAVSRHVDVIARVIDAISSRVPLGGRIIQLGAGTSGRLGVLDASEIPPTFSAPPGLYIGLIAGGDLALRNPIEGAEDSRDQGRDALAQLEPPLSPQDTVIGIATSGRTPYVLGAIEAARKLGCFTVGLCCVSNSSLRAESCDEVIECVVGPEAVTGSTRMKAGTATKMILNMISTGVMIRSGKTYGNLMVDLKTSNQKLAVRARRVLRTIVSAAASDLQSAGRQYSPPDLSADGNVDELLRQCSGSVKLAALVCLKNCDVESARVLLAQSGGRLKAALDT